MARPSRARRILKWTGVGLSWLTVTAWVVSLWLTVTILPSPDFQLVIDRGEIVTDTIPFPLLKSGPFIFIPHGFEDFGFRRPRVFVEASAISQSGSLFLHNPSLPFWLLLLLTAMPTAWLWHRDRRRIRPGCCLRCGYDLTGNTTGVCSECGMAIPPLSTV